MRDRETALADLKVRLLSAPTGVALDANGRRLLWVPDEETGGRDYEIAIEVADSGNPVLVTQARIPVRVVETNLAPEFGELSLTPILG